MCMSHPIVMVLLCSQSGRGATNTVGVVDKAVDIIGLWHVSPHGVGEVAVVSKIHIFSFKFVGFKWCGVAVLK